MKWMRVAIACAVLVACGGQPETSPEAQASLETLDPQGREVVFWYQHTREREEALQALIADFNQNNPYQIKVRGEYVGRYRHL